MRENDDGCVRPALFIRGILLGAATVNDIRPSAARIEFLMWAGVRDWARRVSAIAAL